MIGGNYAFSDRSFDEAKGRVADKYGRILILRNGIQAVANSIDDYHGQIVVQNQWMFGLIYFLGILFILVEGFMWICLIFITYKNAE